MSKRGRPAIKFGKYATFYLGNEVIAMINKMAPSFGNNKSLFIENCVKECYVPDVEEQAKINKIIDKEVTEVIGDVSA